MQTHQAHIGGSGKHHRGLQYWVDCVCIKPTSRYKTHAAAYIHTARAERERRQGNIMGIVFLVASVYSHRPRGIWTETNKKKKATTTT